MVKRTLSPAVPHGISHHMLQPDTLTLVETRALTLAWHCSLLLPVCTVRERRQMQSENVRWKITETAYEFSTVCHSEQRGKVSEPLSSLRDESLFSLCRDPCFSPEPLLVSECSTTVLVFQSLLWYVITAPKPKSNGPGNTDCHGEETIVCFLM